MLEKKTALCGGTAVLSAVSWRQPSRVKWLGGRVYRGSSLIRNSDPLKDHQRALGIFLL